MRRIALLLPLLLAACDRPETKPDAAPRPVVAPPVETPAPATREPETPPPVVVEEPAAPPAPAVEPAPNAEPAKPMIGSLPGDLVPEFKASVRRTGKGATREETLDSRAAKGATVYVVQSVACPFCNDYAERLKKLEAKYAAKGVDFVHLYPMRAETDADKIAWHATQAFAGGQVLDADAKISKALTADHTPTVYVVGAAGVIAYRGAVDDDATGDDVTKQYIADALDAVLAGKPVETPSTDPPG